MKPDQKVNAALDDMEKYPSTSLRYRDAESYITHLSAGSMMQCKTETLARMTGVSLEEYKRMVAEERAKHTRMDQERLGLTPALTLKDIGL